MKTTKTINFGPDSIGQPREYPIRKNQGQYDIFHRDVNAPMENKRWFSTGARTIQELKKLMG